MRFIRDTCDLSWWGFLIGATSNSLRFPTCFLGSRDTRTSAIFQGHFFPITNLPTALSTAKMALVSSKTLIQAHAVLLIIIAGYLVKNPNYITDSDLVFMMGEALKIVRAWPNSCTIALPNQSQN
jgi:hypothetical protein